MTTAPFTGVGVALVTLFDDDGGIDAEATGDLAAQLVDLGVQAVVVAGSTGEASALDAAERRALVAAVRSAVPSGTPVVAGVGAATGRQAVVFTRDAIDAGADAVLALSSLCVDVCRWFPSRTHRDPVALGRAYGDLAVRMVR